ncbi:hypothetical protein TNCT_320631 [Trichonephila clavata]|uniref:Uncharacterized protein n=1 Tax=Trichonephila clavata TaxID=2740835 RepID=A0A8X6FEK2_TRICU|nr:hypothetical protein TNCT_320631 [Trichonephila clavata]
MENTPDGKTESEENTMEEDKRAEILSQKTEGNATEVPKDTDTRNGEENEAGKSVHKENDFPNFIHPNIIEGSTEEVKIFSNKRDAESKLRTLPDEKDYKKSFSCKIIFYVFLLILFTFACMCFSSKFYFSFFYLKFDSGFKKYPEIGERVGSEKSQSESSYKFLNSEKELRMSLKNQYMGGILNFFTGKSSRICKTKTTHGHGTKKRIIGNRKSVRDFISLTRTNNYKRNDERIQYKNSLFLNSQCLPEMDPNASGLNGNFLFVNDDITDNFDEKVENKNKNAHNITSTVLGIQHTFDFIFDPEDITTNERLLDSKERKSCMKHHDSILPENSESNHEKLHILKQIIGSETDYHNFFDFSILLCVLTILTFAVSLFLISYVFFRRKTRCKPGYNLEERKGQKSSISKINHEESATESEYSEKKVKMSKSNEMFFGKTTSELNNGDNESKKQDEENVFGNLGDDANSDQGTSTLSNVEGIPNVDEGLDVKNTPDGTMENKGNVMKEYQNTKTLNIQSEADATKKPKDRDTRKNEENEAGNSVNGDQGAINTNSIEEIPVVDKGLGIENISDGTSESVESTTEGDKRAKILMQQTEEPKVEEPKDTSTRKEEENEAGNSVNGDPGGTKTNEVLNKDTKTKSPGDYIKDETKRLNTEYDKRKRLGENNVERIQSNEFENNTENKSFLNSYLTQKKTIWFYLSLLFLSFTSIIVLSFLYIRSDSPQEIREKGDSIENTIFSDKFLSWKDLGDLITDVNSVNLKDNVFNDLDLKELENSQRHGETEQSKTDSYKSALNGNDDAVDSFDNKNIALVKREIDKCTYGLICDYKRLLKAEDISTIVVTSEIDSVYSNFLLFSLLIFVFINYVYSIVIVLKQIHNTFLRENINNQSITSGSISKDNSQFIQVTMEPKSIIMQDTKVDGNYKKKEVLIEKNVDADTFSSSNTLTNEMIDEEIPHSHSSTTYLDDILKRKETSNASYRNKLPAGGSGDKFVKDQFFSQENEKSDSTVLSFQLSSENNDFEKKLPSSDEITKEAYDKALSAFGIDRESNGKEDESQCGFNEKIEQEKDKLENGSMFDGEHLDRRESFSDSSRYFIQSKQDTEDNENNQYMDEFKTYLGNELEKEVEVQDENPIFDSTLLDIVENTFQKKYEINKCMSYEDRCELEIDPGKESKFEKKEKIKTQRKKLDFDSIASRKKGQSYSYLRNIAKTSEKRSPNSLPNDNIDEISINGIPNILGISELQGVSTYTNVTLPGHTSKTTGKNKNKEENKKSKIHRNVESDISGKKPKSKESTKQEDIIPKFSETTRKPKASEIGDSTSGFQKRKKRIKRSQEMPLVCSSEDAIIENSFTSRQETTTTATRKHRGRYLKQAVDVILLQQGDMRFQFAMKEDMDYKFSFNTEPKLDSFGKLKSIAYNLNLEKKSH